MYRLSVIADSLTSYIYSPLELYYGIFNKMTLLRRFLILSLSFIGIADTVYITRKVLLNVPTNCSIDGYNGCNTVALSAYSHIFSIPMSIYGIIFYGAIFILTAVTFIWMLEIFLKFIRILAAIGVVVSIILTGIEIFVIQAICFYCVFSAIISILIACVAYWRIKNIKLNQFK